MRILSALLIALTALTGCGEAGPSPDLPLAQARHQAARDAADASLRLRLRAQAMPPQRGVQVFAQALPDTLAVCGRTKATGTAGEAFLPYVAVIAFEGGQARAASLALGMDGPEASRVFIAMVDRCFEGGGPSSRRITARAIPPLPTTGPTTGATETAPGPGAAGPADAATPGAIAAAATGRIVITSRSGANIRSSTRGGDILRTVPPSSPLQVLAETPGGWFQVGERGTAWGWVHASALEVGAH